MHRLVLLIVGFALTVGALGAAAQFRSFRGPRMVAELPDERNGFTFCRLEYTQVRREEMGQGSMTDFPMADQNLMVRLAELTLTQVTWHREGDPAHAVVRATDPELFGCPFLFASDAGTAGLTSEEVERLREYLLKGGFLWADDFWGPAALGHWLAEMEQLFPGREAVELPPDHPIYSAFYFVDEVPQIPSIQYWRASGGLTSERGNRSATPTIRGIFDDHGRIMVLMSHNTDIADGWEREGEDFQFFHSFSPLGYAVGINVAIWSMSH
ncbi:MAG: DUF4159 domain-containing protein [Gemmatimonas sp.]|nr:DUF4159 domain-containing protein [Gemmatimonas sp.]